MSDAIDTLGFVVISRNGGPRLRESLASVLTHSYPVVYADSASTDGSPALAREAGADVVILAPDPAPNAARGRNAGFERLAALHPAITFVQFVDGDTTIDATWPQAALRAMAAEPAIAACCGHLREQHATSNIFARLSGVEWRGPVGDIHSTGGNMLVRAAAFAAVGGFDPTLAAGEEANLCARLRSAGGRIVRLDAPMGEHASGVTTFGKWWTRTVRVGRAYSRASRPGAPAAAGKRRQIASAILWAVAMPAAAAAAAIGARWWWPLVIVPLLILAAYIMLWTRVFLRTRARGHASADAALHSAFCILAKWPQAVGILTPGKP